MKKLLTIPVALLLLTGCSSPTKVPVVSPVTVTQTVTVTPGQTSPPVPSTPNPAVEGGTVGEVVDGDTLRLTDGRTIRLIGVDTPERGQCGYKEATKAMLRLVDGQDVLLVRSTVGKKNDRDKYGRLLRYVRVGDLDVGLELIKAGRAKPRYNSTDGYGPHELEAAYAQAASEFKNNNVCGSL